MTFDVNAAIATILTKLESWLENITAMLPNLILAIFCFIIFFNLARRLFSRVISKAVEDKNIQSLLTQLVYYVFIAIKKAYDAHDITMLFPIRTLDFGIKGGTKLSELNLAAALNGK